MLDPLTITILVIILVALIAAYVRRWQIDKCLKHFDSDPITLEKVSGKTPATGLLNVKHTGMEFRYIDKIVDEKGLLHASYIIYKSEYHKIRALIRFHDQLNDEERKKRAKELRRTYHPNLWRRMKRRLINLMKTLRDAISEIIGVLISQFQKVGQAGKVLSSQSKYITQLRDDVIESVGIAYEPLLEAYIGHRVIFEMAKNDELVKYNGILKDYTADFIEIIDVNYRVNEEENEYRKADLIISQSHGIVRHLGE